MSPLDPAESDDEGWEEREASRTHSVKFTEDVDPGGTEPGKEDESSVTRSGFRSDRLSSTEVDPNSERSSYSESTTKEEPVRECTSRNRSCVQTHMGKSPICWRALEVIPYGYQTRFKAMVKKKEEVINEGVDNRNATPPGSISIQSEIDGVLDIREERLEIRLEKTNAGLGLSIAGGQGSTPFKGDDEGIFVSKVTEGGPADLADLRNAVYHPGMDTPTSSLSTSRAPSVASNHSSTYNTLTHNGPTHHQFDKLKRGDYEVRKHNIYVTLIRDQNGLGFSIAGGKGCPPYKDDSNINGVELDGARHDQAVSMLTGLERFVRLVAEREVVVPKVSSPQPTQSPGSKKSPSEQYVVSCRIIPTRTEKYQNEADRSSTPPTSTAVPSPPRPLPRRVLTSQTSSASESDTTPLTEQNRDDIKLGEPRTKPMTSEEFQAMIPAHFLSAGGGSRAKTTDKNDNSVGKPEATMVTLTIKAPNPGLANGIEFPDAPTNLGRVTETITKSTLTETVVTRVTDNQLAESVIIE
ncbi:unnamed protein product, partial [Nesidiocoris tenuis]